ncbi:MAG: hypothetical protein V5783_11410 [Pontiella sp.]
MDLTAKNVKQLQAQNMRIEVEIRFLKLKFQTALGKLFGSSSENISPDQLALEFGVDSVAPGMPEAEAETEEVVVPRKKRKYKLLSECISEDLPVEEIIIEPAAVLADPEAFKRIGEEVIEELDVVPTKFFKRCTVRPKYVRTTVRSHPWSPPHPNGLSKTPTPTLGCSQASCSPNTPTTFRSTASRRSTRPATASTSAARPWLTGCSASHKCSR